MSFDSAKLGNYDPEVDEIANQYAIANYLQVDEQALGLGWGEAWFDGAAIDPRQGSFGGFGLNGRRFDHIARVNPIISMANRLYLNAVSKVPTTIQSSPLNNYKEYPQYEEISDRLVEEINYMLCTLKHEYQPFERAKRDLLYSARVCGYGLGQLIWDFVDGKYRIIGIKVKKSWDFHPVPDEFGNLKSYYHFPTGRFYDARMFIVVIWPFLHGENYLGMSIIEPIYHNIVELNKLVKLRDVLCNRASLTWVIHKYNPKRSKERNDAAKIAINNANGAGAVIHLPGDIDPEKRELVAHDELEILAHRGDAEVLKQLDLNIEHHHKIIVRAMDIPDDMGYTNTSVGSQAKATVQKDLYAFSPEDGANLLCEAVNSQIIYRYIWLNEEQTLSLPNFYLPICQKDSMNEIDLQVKSARILEWKKNGIINVDEAREKLGLPPLKVEDTVDSGADEEVINDNEDSEPEDEYIEPDNEEPDTGEDD